MVNPKNAAMATVILALPKQRMIRVYIAKSIRKDRPPTIPNFSICLISFSMIIVFFLVFYIPAYLSGRRVNTLSYSIRFSFAKSLRAFFPMPKILFMFMELTPPCLGLKVMGI